MLMLMWLMQIQTLEALSDCRRISEVAFDSTALYSVASKVKQHIDALRVSKRTVHRP